MTDAYMAWDLHRANPVPPFDNSAAEGVCSVRVVDVFSKFDSSVLHLTRLILFTGTYKDAVHLFPDDPFVGCSFIRNGLMPTAPIKPTVAVTIQALELYRLEHFRCPRLSISAFVKSLADLHGVSLSGL